jgi:cation transport ATPase
MKSTTAKAVRDLHTPRLRIVMLTSDNRRTTTAMAKTLGLDMVEAEIEPGVQVAQVKKLRA